VLADRIGRGARGQVRRLTTDALVLGLLVAGVLVALGLATMRPLFVLLGATDETLPLVREYMSVWYLGVLFVVVPMIGNHAIRATGDTLTPSVLMVIQMGMNIVLDPPLIFGAGPIPALGVRGAALATVLARAVGLLAAVYILGVRKRMLARPHLRLGPLLASFRAILFIGIPAAGSMMLRPLSFALLTRLAAWFGTAAVAAFGAAVRVEQFVILPIISLGVVLLPFVGQNRGAARPGRIYAAFRTAWLFDVAWGLSGAVLLALLAGPIAGIFTDDPPVHHFLVLLLCVAPLAYGFKGISQMAIQSMNGLHKPYHAWGASLLRVCGLLLPGALIGGLVGGFAGFVVGSVVAEVVGALLLARVARRLFDRVLSPETCPADS